MTCNFVKSFQLLQYFIKFNLDEICNLKNLKIIKTL